MTARRTPRDARRHVDELSRGRRIAVRLLALLVRPQRAGSATHAGLAAAAWLVAAAVVGDPDNHGGHAGPIDLAFVMLAVPTLIAALLAAPWRAWRSGGLVRPELVLAAAAGVPWLWYGLQQGLMQRYTWPPMADPHHQAHWFVMSLVALLIVLVCAGAALSGSGWRAGAVTSGASGTAIAIASLAAPDGASALRPVSAVGALLWGITILALTWRASRGISSLRAFGPRESA